MLIFLKYEFLFLRAPAITTVLFWTVMEFPLLYQFVKVFAFMSFYMLILLDVILQIGHCKSSVNEVLSWPPWQQKNYPWHQREISWGSLRLWLCMKKLKKLQPTVVIGKTKTNERSCRIFGKNMVSPPPLSSRGKNGLTFFLLVGYCRKKFWWEKSIHFVCFPKKILSLSVSHDFSTFLPKI